MLNHPWPKCFQDGGQPSSSLWMIRQPGQTRAGLGEVGRGLEVCLGEPVQSVCVCVCVCVCLCLFVCVCVCGCCQRTHTTLKVELTNRPVKLKMNKHSNQLQKHPSANLTILFFIDLVTIHSSLHVFSFASLTA